MNRIFSEVLLYRTSAQVEWQSPIQRALSESPSSVTAQVRSFSALLTLYPGAWLPDVLNYILLREILDVESSDDR